jgi:hypothetical protein
MDLFGGGDLVDELDHTLVESKSKQNERWKNNPKHEGEARLAQLLEKRRQPLLQVVNTKLHFDRNIHEYLPVAEFVHVPEKISNKLTPEAKTALEKLSPLLIPIRLRKFVSLTTYLSNGEIEKAFNEGRIRIFSPPMRNSGEATMTEEERRGRTEALVFPEEDKILLDGKELSLLRMMPRITLVGNKPGLRLPSV